MQQNTGDFLQEMMALILIQRNNFYLTDLTNSNLDDGITSLDLGLQKKNLIIRLVRFLLFGCLRFFFFFYISPWDYLYYKISVQIALLTQKSSEIIGNFKFSRMLAITWYTMTITSLSFRSLISKDTQIRKRMFAILLYLCILCSSAQHKHWLGKHFDYHTWQPGSFFSPELNKD